MKLYGYKKCSDGLYRKVVTFGSNPGYTRTEEITRDASGKLIAVRQITAKEGSRLKNAFEQPDLSLGQPVDEPGTESNEDSGA